MRKIFIALFITFLTTSCLKKVENSGYSFDNVNLNDIKAGITTKENVLIGLGSPSIKSLLDKEQSEVWIYYNDKQYGYLFFNPVIVNQQILTLTFDEDDVVATINSYDSNNARNISISEDYTKKEQVKESLIRDILDNIGTVRGM